MFTSKFSIFKQDSFKREECHKKDAIQSDVYCRGEKFDNFALVLLGGIKNRGSLLYTHIYMHILHFVLVF